MAGPSLPLYEKASDGPSDLNFNLSYYAEDTLEGVLDRRMGSAAAEDMGAPTEGQALKMRASFCRLPPVLHIFLKRDLSSKPEVGSVN